MKNEPIVIPYPDWIHHKCTVCHRFVAEDGVCIRHPVAPILQYEVYITMKEVKT